MTKILLEMKDSKKHIETILPFFTGFYHSIWYDGDTEYYEAEEVATELDYPQDEIADVLIDIIDYKKRESDISEQVASLYEAQLIEAGYIEALEFQGVYSPSYYNFSTDKINVRITANAENLAKLKKDFESNKDNPDLIQAIKDTFTSYDGFMSFHSNDINSEEWDNFIEDEYKFIWMSCKLAEIESGSNFDDMQLYYDVNDTHICLYYSIEELKRRLEANDE